MHDVRRRIVADTKLAVGAVKEILTACAIFTGFCVAAPKEHGGGADY